MTMPRRKAVYLTPRGARETRRREQINEIRRQQRLTLQLDNDDENQASTRPRKNQITHGAARLIDTADFSENEAPYTSKHRCGALNIECPHCHALRWQMEKPTFCCQNGKIKLEIPPPPPPALLRLYQDKRVLSASRSYNNALAMASIGCHEIRQNGFNPTFTIQGKLHHTIGSLLPVEGNEPKFAQVFFVDSGRERQIPETLDRNILKDIQTILQNINTYIQSFKTAIEINNRHPELMLVLHSEKKESTNAHIHRGTLNLPTASEVAALIPGENVGNMDIVIQCKGNQELKRISTCHRSYDPLHYVLMFPHGTDGWCLGLRKTDNKTLTATDFYSYRLQVRNGHFNPILKMGRLTQQYAVDQWAKIEGSRLQWARFNQKSIRAEKYQGLLDAVHAGDVAKVGTKIVLPPTIYGSPRFYAESFQNAMAIVRTFGKPDLFITFTCNPKWNEITSALHDGEHACERPDLTARVFKLKFDALMDDLIKGQIFGEVRAYTCTIEFQKRGLPHVHILLILSNDCKPNSPEKIDEIVCAEIPNKENNPELHAIVTSNNIHGPCGAVNPSSPCMDGDDVKHCTKNFPKMFCDSTSVSENAYPQYRRRGPDDGGFTHEMKIKGQDFTVDNSFVVPYNPLLSFRYQAHINVEIVHTVQAVKYLYKYVTKGQDRILFGVQGEQDDEIANYVNARYISASEAFWRIYEFEIHRKYPPVEKLPCHLPNEQMVIFEDTAAEQALLNGPAQTKLTAFFHTNATDDTARHILYSEFPRYFTWNSKERKWQRRKRGKKNDNEEFTTDCIGRVPTVSLSPHQSELYYLRMLLHHVRGPTSFENIRTVNHIICPTFQEACRLLGLLEDDAEKDRAMEEAASIRFGHQLRSVFATILMYCRPADPLQFWMRHKNALCDDLIKREKADHLSNDIENLALIDLQNILDTEHLDLARDFHLPPARQVEDLSAIPKTIRDELNFDRQNLQVDVDQKYETLNTEQKHVFNTVLASVNNNRGAVFALDASGGTGKTHVINLLLSAARASGKIALATAMSGIAANLLLNGRTFHSRFKVPLQIHENSTCSMSPNDTNGKLMRLADFVVIDEVSMGHKYVFEALDRSLQDLRDCSKPFGGLTVLFAGDWRQVLPVVRHGSRPQIVNSTLKMSSLWAHVQLLKLKENMRVKLTGESADFSNFLLSVGNGLGRTQNASGQFKMKIPEELFVPSKKDLIEFVFGNVDLDTHSLSSRAIVCATNASADEINEHVMTLMSSTDQQEYKSCDSVEENEHQYPIEFINKLCPSGLPPHRLFLKKHSIIMLLRNLDPQNGHCNGTRYVVEKLHSHVIDATIAVGPHKGKRIFIPRIPMVPSDNIYPFSMKRKQFPVKPAFAITANKAQGQTLKAVGIYLPEPFFSHGQLYVAMSRVGNKDNVKIFTPHTDSNIDNVVYPEILTN